VLRFEVLGPLRVLRDGLEVDLGPAQQRSVLALLLARAGEPVTIAEFADLLWGADPPSRAARTTWRPFAASCRANSRPMPDEAPVTRAQRPKRSAEIFTRVIGFPSSGLLARLPRASAGKTGGRTCLRPGPPPPM
jgi:hypothetical protein